MDRFVTTPELQSEDSIGTDPLPPGQVWAISPSAGEQRSGLYRIEANESPGSGVRMINRPTPPPFLEAIRLAEQNLYGQGHGLVGDRDPRAHEFTVQLRAFDSARSGAGLSVPALLAMSSALLARGLKGGLIVVGSLNLGGTLEPVHNAVDVTELAVEKGATTLLLPVSARRQLYDLSDDTAIKVNVLFYSDVRDALVKALAD